MTSTRPYLLRAIYEWIVDNGMTPHLLVEAGREGVDVPLQYVENGVIVLNVSPSAVRDLDLGNERVTFSARFAGTPHYLVVPLEAVQAVYARENGQGIFLGDSEVEPAPAAEGAEAADDTDSAGEGARSPAARAPHLTVVK